MVLQFARFIFITLIVGLVLFFSFGSKHIRIETNLNDLNPTKISDQSLKYAMDTLTQDVSHRFIVVLKGKEQRAVEAAAEQMQAQLSELKNLLVVSDQHLQSNYLAALSPFRFNLLSDAQRQSLTDKGINALASDAQRKLYQLGNGVRLIPFEQDPLGWFSEYLLSSLDKLNIVSTMQESAEESEEVTSSFTSFAVSITEYPENMAQQQSLYQSIKDIEFNVSQAFDVNILHSGMFFFAVDSAQSAKSDIQLIAIGSIVGVLLLMLMVFRSLLPLFLSLSSIAIGVGFGVLISTLAFGSIHILTIVFGASLIGIVVDYSLHYFYHFLSHNQDPAHNRNHAKTLYRAMLLSVLTSLIGYGALSISDLVILKKVALFSCAGLIMAWISVMILGPLVTRRPIVARQVFLRKVIAASQAVFASHPRALIGAGLIFASIAGLYLYTNQSHINDDPRLFFHVSNSLLEQEKEVASLTEVYEPGRYLIVKGRDSDQVFESLAALYNTLGNQSRQLSSVLDWLPSPGTQVQDYQYQQSLYQDGGVTDTFFEKLGLNAAQSEPIKTAYRNAENRILDFPTLMQDLPSLPPLWVEHDGRVFSFVLIRKNSDLDSIDLASRAIGNIEYVNTLANASDALKAQRVTGSKLLFLAYALIAVMLALYYRQISAVLLLLIPLVASAITLASVSALGQPITVFHIMALFLVLGLGMDYIIFAKEMTEQRAITQQAILLSAVTSLLSFGLLAFSSMPIVQAFGSTILIGNSINFIAAISLFNRPRLKMEKRLNVE